MYVPYDHLFVQALTHRKYSTKSDVWSFGVVLFEIWAIGKKPYGGTSNPDVSPLVPVLSIVELSQAIDGVVRNSLYRVFSLYESNWLLVINDWIHVYVCM